MDKVQLMLSLIYLGTGNLFIAVGVHALIDAPTMLLTSGLVPHVAIAVAALIVLVAESRLRRARTVSPIPAWDVVRLK